MKIRETYIGAFEEADSMKTTKTIFRKIHKTSPTSDGGDLSMTDDYVYFVEKHNGILENISKRQFNQALFLING